MSDIKIDVDNKSGKKWVLTGSQHFELMKGVRESLAGRVALLELPPFSLEEYPYTDLEDVFYYGFYPEVALHREKRDFWISSYISTYIERDIRNIGIIRNLKLFEDFISLLASHHGQEFNASIISRQLGISVPTVKSWVSLLGSTYIVYLVSPYYQNLGKRVIKSSKLYFLDPILVAYLTHHTTRELTVNGPLQGVFFEGFIISEFIKFYNARGEKAPIFFWRSSDGLEVDLLLNRKGILFPFEIKNTSTPSSKHVRSLEKFKRIAGKTISDTGYVICRVDKRTPLPHSNTAVSWSEIDILLKEIEACGKSS